MGDSQHLDGAPLVAEMIDQACRGYVSFWSHLLPPSSEESEARGCEAVRQKGLMFSTLLDEAKRVVAEEVVDVNGQPFPPPPGVVRALHNLQDSYTLMMGIRSYDDLLNQPFIPWEEIEAELDKPECREWMEKALAAYPVPEKDGRE